MPRAAKISTAILFCLALAFTALFLRSGDGDADSQTTDDAYVRADSTRVAPRVDGEAVEVLAEENAPVSKGDVLVVIDDRDHVLQAAAAEATLAGASASLASLEAKLAQQDDVVAQAEATVAADAATVELDRLEYERYRNLASDGSGSRQSSQKAEAAYRVAKASLARDAARRDAEIRQKAVLAAEIERARAQVAQASAALDLARLNLSWCRVVAPVDGVASQKTVRVGGWYRKGEPLVAIVPLKDVYVDAYFRETQLARIRPGQKVSMTVDALPGRTLSGVVESLGPASNASFSPIAPHSTSSNFTKIVQRLPVRIAVAEEDRKDLRVGMSVVVTVDTR